MPTSLKQDVLRLRKYKKASVDLTRRKKTADEDFKRLQAAVLERMDREEVESIKVAGTLFSPVRDKVYARIVDRSEFVRWALGESEAVAEMANAAEVDVDQLVDALQQAIDETPFIKLAEHADPLNAEVRARLDDGQILPPGVSFRTDNYISQRAS